jgi:hypothetical protein
MGEYKTNAEALQAAERRVQWPCSRIDHAKPEEAHCAEVRVQRERPIHMEILLVGRDPVSGNVALCHR